MNNPKIQCNVNDCSHNCNEDCTCRLETIKVCPCPNLPNTDKAEDQTACSMYNYCGDLNARANYTTKQI